MKNKTVFLLQSSESNADDNANTITSPANDEQKSMETANLLLGLWRLRSEQLGKELGFDDETSWNILLDLFVSDSKGRSVVSSDLAFAYLVPKSTLGRYVDFLCEKRLVNKVRDPKNKVRVLLSLTEYGTRLLSKALERMGSELIARQKIEL